MAWNEDEGAGSTEKWAESSSTAVAAATFRTLARARSHCRVLQQLPYSGGGAWWGALPRTTLPAGSRGVEADAAGAAATAAAAGAAAPPSAAAAAAARPPAETRSIDR